MMTSIKEQSTESLLELAASIPLQIDEAREPQSKGQTPKFWDLVALNIQVRNELNNRTPLKDLPKTTRALDEAFGVE